MEGTDMGDDMALTIYNCHFCLELSTNPLVFHGLRMQVVLSPHPVFRYLPVLFQSFWNSTGRL